MLSVPGSSPRGARAPAMAPNAPTVKLSRVVSTYGIKVDEKFPALVIVSGSASDVGLNTKVDQPIVIGRDPNVNLPIQDTASSRRHACVEQDLRTGVYGVRDLGSTNGTRKDGTRLTATPVPLKDGDRIVIGQTIIKFTLTDEIESSYHQTLDTMMGRDALTGTLTVRKFDLALAQSIETAREAGTTVAIFMMDMDGLKTMNDTHGHHCGTHAITVVGKMIAERFGAGMQACRYGGDEFQAFVSGFGKEQAMQLAEDLRRDIESAAVDLDGTRLRPTISIGVACFPADGDDMEIVSKAADAALYRAKAAGRNRVSD